MTRRKVKPQNPADRQLEDFPSEVLAAFIRQEWAIPFALGAEQCWRKLLRVEAELESERTYGHRCLVNSGFLKELAFVYLE